MLNYLFGKENRVTTIYSIICVVFGLLFCIIPIKMLEFLEPSICFLLLAYGGIVLFANSVTKVVSSNKTLIISSIVAILFGVLLLFVRSFFILVLGLMLLILSISKALVIKKQGLKKELSQIIGFILMIVEFLIVLAIIVFFILNKFKDISMILVGICLFFEGLSNIIFLILMKNLIEKRKLLSEEINQNNNENNG